MIEKKHTRPDGTTWTEWTPEKSPEERRREILEFDKLCANVSMRYHWALAKAEVKQLRFTAALANWRAMWAWAKVVAACDTGLRALDKPETPI